MAESVNTAKSCLKDVNNNNVSNKTSLSHLEQSKSEEKAGIKFQLNNDSESSDESEEHQIYRTSLVNDDKEEKTSKRNNPVTGN